ncbi:MAG TPA: hypothetical protein VFD01_17000 [Candidatus Dormibacteraeota bacterium]|nr:hypothetical protein [Candidatus Dormibacteraeota bacterium]
MNGVEASGSLPPRRLPPGSSGAVILNGNRAARRAMGAPTLGTIADLMIAPAGPYCFLGVRGGRGLRLTLDQAREVSEILAAIAEGAQPFHPDPEELET